MRRPVLLVALLLAGCGPTETEPVQPARQAEPQRASSAGASAIRPPAPGSVRRRQARRPSRRLVGRRRGHERHRNLVRGRPEPAPVRPDAVRHGQPRGLEQASRNGSLPAPRLAARLQPDPPGARTGRDVARDDLRARRARRQQLVARRLRDLQRPRGSAGRHGHVSCRGSDRSHRRGADSNGAESSVHSEPS